MESAGAPIVPQATAGVNCASRKETTRQMAMTEEEALHALRGDDVAAAARAADALWGMWHRSGDARLDGMLHEGIEAMERQEPDAGGAVFSRLSATAPAF